jgi:ankyrin repeat protein
MLAQLLVGTALLGAEEPPAKPSSKEASVRLKSAGAANNFKLAQTLIEAGADVNYSGGCVYCSPLNRAIKLGNSVMVDFLLERGARPTWPSLWLAASIDDANQSLEMVKALFAAGANASAKTKDAVRPTPLTAAGDRGHDELIGSTP